MPDERWGTKRIDGPVSSVGERLIVEALKDASMEAVAQHHNIDESELVYFKATTLRRRPNDVLEIYYDYKFASNGPLRRVRMTYTGVLS